MTTQILKNTFLTQEEEFNLRIDKLMQNFTDEKWQEYIDYEEFIFSVEEKFQNQVPNVPNVPDEILEHTLVQKVNLSSEVKTFEAMEEIVGNIPEVVAPLNQKDEVSALEAAIQFIDLIVSNDSCSIKDLYSAEFIKAIISVKAHSSSLYMNYRTKMKDKKPAGFALGHFEELISEELKSRDKPKDSRKSGDIASNLVSYVCENGDVFIDAGTNKACVTIENKGVQVTYEVLSGEFSDWLGNLHYNESKSNSTRGEPLREPILKQVASTLNGIAKNEGSKKQTFIRVGCSDQAYFIFMNNLKQQVIEVNACGWSILDQSSVKFLVKNTMKDLPVPEVNGDYEKLWDYINIPEKYRLLVLAWILEAFRPDTPYPILALYGQQGTAKSSTQKKLKELLDNNVSNLRNLPKTTQEIFLSASGLIISYENVSFLNADVQDAFCSLATGSGFVTRELYTNNGEFVIEAKRAIIINSIPIIVTAQDLASRTILIELPKIAYKSESDLKKDWDSDKGSILGGLMDLFVKTLNKLPSVELEELPRMADFAKLGEAMSQVLGHDVGYFTRVYKENSSDIMHDAIEDSPVALAVVMLVSGHEETAELIFHGTMQQLLTKLKNFNPARSPRFPNSPKGLSDQIRRQIHALENVGIKIEFSQTREVVDGFRGKTVRISKDMVRWHVGHLKSETLETNKKNKNYDFAIDLTQIDSNPSEGERSEE